MVFHIVHPSRCSCRLEWSAGLGLQPCHFLPLTRVIFYLYWHGEIVLPPSTMIINTLLRIAMLVVSAGLVNQARLISELRKTVKTLEGILPICASCKNIRNESGTYEQIEAHICRHSKAQFSHGICPECMKKLYPEYAGKMNK
jgi:hypothetical protein